jgi:hypothetical protein
MGTHGEGNEEMADFLAARGGDRKVRNDRSEKAGHLVRQEPDALARISAYGRTLAYKHAGFWSLHPRGGDWERDLPIGMPGGLSSRLIAGEEDQSRSCSTRS